jgi:hypothetical protein
MPGVVHESTTDAPPLVVEVNEDRPDLGIDQ